MSPSATASACAHTQEGSFLEFFFLLPYPSLMRQVQTSFKTSLFDRYIFCWLFSIFLFLFFPLLWAFYQRGFLLRIILCKPFDFLFFGLVFLCRRSTKGAFYYVLSSQVSQRAYRFQIFQTDFCHFMHL